MVALRLGLLCLVFTPSAVFAQEGPPRWPQFRGVGGRAVAQEDKPLPAEFGPAKNVRWKTPLPSGLSSPCVWGDVIFITGYEAKEKKLETLCLDARTGSIRWRRTAPA